LFNVKLTAIFGAAGIAGIAIGFAAQTSISNIISGFFLLSEQAFKVGDYISVGDDSGTVDSVDMLCVRIHTPDNQFIRIPNESIIKTNLKNNSYFAKRRYTMSLTIPYDADLKAAVKVLETVPEHCDLSLKEPAPQVFAEEFSDFGIKLTLNAWTESCNYLAFRNQIILATKESFDKNNIKIATKNFIISK
jgi:small-conductance mechanosensitive channel